MREKEGNDIWHQHALDKDDPERVRICLKGRILLGDKNSYGCGYSICFFLKSGS